MNTQDQKTEDRLLALEKKYDKILEVLEPISDTYKAVSRLGKWVMVFLVFISILLGVIISSKSIIVGIKSLFK